MPVPLCNFKVSKIQPSPKIYCCKLEVIDAVLNYLLLKYFIVDVILRQV